MGAANAKGVGTKCTGARIGGDCDNVVAIDVSGVAHETFATPEIASRVGEAAGWLKSSAGLHVVLVKGVDVVDTSELVGLDFVPSMEGESE